MLIVFDRDLDFFGPSAVDVDRIIPIVKQHPGTSGFPFYRACETSGFVQDLRPDAMYHVL